MTDLDAAEIFFVIVAPESTRLITTGLKQRQQLLNVMHVTVQCGGMTH